MTRMVTYKTVLEAVSRQLSWIYMDDERVVVTKSKFCNALLLSETTTIRSSREWWIALQDLGFFVKANKDSCFVNLPQVMTAIGRSVPTTPRIVTKSTPKSSETPGVTCTEIDCEVA